MTDHIDALLRMPEVVRLTGRGKWTIYEEARAGLFTKPVHIGPRAVAWPASEVAALNRAKIAGAKPEELQKLVRDLHARRKPQSETPPGEAAASSGKSRARG